MHEDKEHRTSLETSIPPNLGTELNFSLQQPLQMYRRQKKHTCVFLDKRYTTHESHFVYVNYKMEIGEGNGNEKLIRNLTKPKWKGEIEADVKPNSFVWNSLFFRQGQKKDMFSRPFLLFSSTVMILGYRKHGLNDLIYRLRSWPGFFLFFFSIGIPEWKWVLIQSHLIFR